MFFSRKILFLMFLIVLLLCSSVVFAEEPEKIEKVIVIGMGADASQARQDAIHNAVEQVVGTYVSSDTMVQNSELIKDEILTYSGGFVKESRVISQKRVDDLIEVQLEALVVATKLKRKIQALNIAVKKVDGGSLFGEAFSKAEAGKAGTEQLKKILSKYPQAAYLVEIGKPEIQSINHSNNKAKIKLNIKINFDNTYIEELQSVLKTISSKQFSNTGISDWGHSSNQLSNQLKDTELAFMFTSNNLLLNSISNKVYFIDVGETMLQDGTGVLNKISREHNSDKLNLMIELCDSSNSTLNIIRINIGDSTDNYKTSQDFPPFNARFPLIMKSMYGYRVLDKRYHDMLFVLNKPLNYEVAFDSDISLLNQVSSIKASFETFGAGN